MLVAARRGGEGVPVSLLSRSPGRCPPARTASRCRGPSRRWRPDPPGGVVHFRPVFTRSEEVVRNGRLARTQLDARERAVHAPEARDVLLLPEVHASARADIEAVDRLRMSGTWGSQDGRRPVARLVTASLISSFFRPPRRPRLAALTHVVAQSTPGAALGGRIPRAADSFSSL